MSTEMEAPPADLPAAHSMDTEWFAIDGNGHIGVFSSQETGEVPEAHFATWEHNSMWSDLLDEMVRLAPPGAIRFVADGVFDEPRKYYEDGTLVTELNELDWSDSETSVLLELDAPREPEVIHRHFESAYVLGCEQPLVYMSRCLVLDVCVTWHELGIVRALLRPPMHPSRFGVFRYENREWSGVVYDRKNTPMGAALRVESLATGLRRRLAEVRMPEVDFSRDAEVHPSTWLPTRFWG